jgi:hypothetical protein
VFELEEPENELIYEELRFKSFIDANIDND